MAEMNAKSGATKLKNASQLISSGKGMTFPLASNDRTRGNVGTKKQAIGPPSTIDQKKPFRQPIKKACPADRNSVGRAGSSSSARGGLNGSGFARMLFCSFIFETRCWCLVNVNQIWVEWVIGCDHASLCSKASVGLPCGRWPTGGAILRAGFGWLRSIGVAFLSIPADISGDERSNASLRIRCHKQPYES